MSPAVKIVDRYYMISRLEQVHHRVKGGKSGRKSVSMGAVFQIGKGGLKGLTGRVCPAGIDISVFVAGEPFAIGGTGKNRRRHRPGTVFGHLTGMNRPRFELLVFHFIIHREPSYSKNPFSCIQSSLNILLIYLPPPSGRITTMILSSGRVLA